MSKKVKEILQDLKSRRNPANVEGMMRYGIKAENAYGVNIPYLRNIAKKLRYNHSLAIELWETGKHEAQILALLIDNPEEVSEEQMEKWVSQINSWDICDGCCSNLFDKTPFAYRKAVEWSRRKEEFVKRAGFVLMATLSVHDKKADDKKFLRFFPLIEREAKDERNFVRKAVNWALRQIGKRNLFLQKEAIKLAEKIHKQEYKSSKWIAADALRELKNKNTEFRS